MMKNPSVCFVNATRKWGGVKTWCINTACDLEKQGVHCVLFGRDHRFVDKAKDKGLDAHRVRFGFDYNPATIAKFYQFFKRKNIGCVIVNIGKDLKSAGLAARLLGIPVIHRIGSPGDVRLTLENRLLHVLIRPAIICCSEFTRKGFLRNLPYLEHFTSTAIHPGVEISEHPLSARKPYKIITTSQINKDKGHIDVILACKILSDENVDYSLNIVGEGSLSAQLQQKVRDLGIEERVTFSGFKKDVIKELRAADFFVLPSHCEPLGIALEEAMANGLIPIARNAGGVPEIWPDFLEGNLLPPESSGQEFANTLITLLALPDNTVTALKNKVRDHAKKTFSSHNQSQHILQFISLLHNAKD